MSKRGGQGRREREQSIRTLRRRIAQHEQKLADNPTSPDRAHWLGEIAAFRAQIEKHRRRLG